MADRYMRREAMHHFRWLKPGRIPLEFDLRISGWALDESGEPSSACIGVLDAGALDENDLARIRAYPEDMRRYILVITNASAQERTQLLLAGFGEAVADTIAPYEFDARARRLAELTRWLPRHRTLGNLELDLLAREAYSAGKSLNLNPREFALIWRLADNPGEPVSKQHLIQDVWRMGFVPETNSIAVHMSRLRRKLSFAGLAGMITTTPTGAYCLLAPGSARTGSGAGHPHGAQALQSGQC